MNKRAKTYIKVREANFEAPEKEVPEEKFFCSLVERIKQNRILYGPPGTHSDLVFVSTRGLDRRLTALALLSKHHASFLTMFWDEVSEKKFYSAEQWDEVIGDLICWSAIYRESREKWNEQAKEE